MNTVQSPSHHPLFSKMPILLENSNATALEKALEKKEELKEKFTESQNKLTESKWFKKFVDSTFSTIGRFPHWFERKRWRSQMNSRHYDI
jgi:hypothetical protein